MSTRKILKQRQKTHGDWAVGAGICQNIMRALMAGRNWNDMTDVQKESLHMIAQKQQRIVNGDPNHPDHWHDIAGYATRCSDYLPKKRKK